MANELGIYLRRTALVAEPGWLEPVQTELQAQRLAGWLVYDFRGSNPFVRRLFDLGGALLTRRLFCFVPTTGTPILLVHAIERGSLPDVGMEIEVRSYGSRASLREALETLVPKGRVAMEYSPMNNLPYVSYVDGGTLELIRAVGAEVVSSAELLQHFSLFTNAQQEAHLQAVAHVMRAKDVAFESIAERTSRGEAVRESEVQAVIAAAFDAHGLLYDHPAIVGFGPHAGDPHYAPVAGSDRVLQPGDAILIDLWAKLPDAPAPYADVTWMGSFGPPSAQLHDVFAVVTQARDLAVKTIAAAYRQGRHPAGFEIDRAVRDFITAKGYGDAFLHRTGHSLGTRTTHGEGAHLDDFETHDTRTLRPGLGVTVEPGVYLETLGVRSEINLLLTTEGPHVTTLAQTDLVVIGTDE